MRIDYEPKLGFRDVLIRPKRSTLRSRSEVELERTFTFRNSGATWTGVPVIAANMDTVGTFAMSTALAEFRMPVAVHKHYSPAEWRAFLHDAPDSAVTRCMLSMGARDEDLNLVREVLAMDPRLSSLVIDVANGYSEHFVEFVSRVRAEFPRLTIAAGNVVTGEMVEELLLAGADIIKVGIGPGSVCTTRVKTGVGYPQLSAIIECADAAHGLGGHIIADGGCTSPGDVAKAIAAGADFVMIGGMLAGHDESGGEVISVDGRKQMEFYGMSSRTAMDKYAGGVASYRASEGKRVLVDYRGPVSGTVQDILGGLRSCCTYVGAGRLKELSKRTTFILVREQENRVFGNDA